MEFGIVTHAIHKIKGDKIYSYEPYVREMNLWGKHVDKITILSPIEASEISEIETAYNHQNINILKIPNFNIKSIKNIFFALFIIPKICFSIFKLMRKTDHIHLRCPGNIGLLGCFIQVFYPSKSKTVKYAGNWEIKSKQPLSYKLQKWILSNTFLTKNCKVLVYGKWKNQSKNIVPFFTASYSEKEIENIEEKKLSNTINLIFVGSFSKGKQPLKSVLVAEDLIKKGYFIKLNMYGYGEEFVKVKNYVENRQLASNIFLHGNQSKEVIKIAFQKSHFLVFISKSEGWPKVVAEAMFWSCLPISTNVSCVPYMLDYGNRGALVSDNVDEIVLKIESYIANEYFYKRSINNAKKWSQNYTLDKFESEIEKFL